MGIDMSIHPRFIDNECAIIFSFYFNNASMKVGEAVIYTCEENRVFTSNKDQSEMSQEPSEKIAYITELTIAEDLKNQSIFKIQNFLRIIGISKFIYNEKQI